MTPAPDPPATSSRLPHIGWWIAGTVLLSIVTLGLAIGLPWYRTCRAIRTIRENGGTVHINSRRPAWIEEWFEDPPSFIPWHDRITDVSVRNISDPDLLISWFGERRELKSLRVHGGRISAAGALSLRNNPGLNVIELVGVEIGDDGLAPLAALPDLTRLVVDHPTDGQKRLTDACLESLENMTGFDSLALKHTRITGSGFDRLARSAHGLTQLDVSGSPVNDAGLRQLPDLPVLGMLVLARTGVTDEGLAVLAEFPRLAGLDLTGTRVRGSGLRSLAGHEHLIGLDLTDVLIDDDGVAAISDLRLHFLSLAGTRITDRGLRNLASARNTYSVLSLSRTAVTDEGVTALVTLPAIGTLALDGTRVTGEAFRLAEEGCRIGYLHLVDCPVDDEGAAAIACIRDLRSLDLTGTSITDVALESLQTTDTLRELRVDRTQVTKEGLSRLRAVRPDVALPDSLDHP